jgi:hypothetical protein
MAAPHLTAVTGKTCPAPSAEAELYNLKRDPENGAQRLRRLQQEARMLAREQLEDLVQAINILASQAAEIADGGEAFPAGVREMASRIASDLPDKGKSLRLLMERSSRA